MEKKKLADFFFCSFALIKGKEWWRKKKSVMTSFFHNNMTCCDWAITNMDCSFTGMGKKMM
jgi:hypothetical protein